MANETIESTIEAIRADLQRHHRPTVERAEGVRAALDAYVAAVEAALAARLRGFLGLSCPTASEHPSNAARDLRASVDALLADTLSESHPDHTLAETTVEGASLLAELLNHGEFEDVPNDIFRAWAEEYAARARIIQDRVGERDRDAPEVRVIRKLTALASKRGLNDIFGLNRRHRDDWWGRVELARRRRAEITANAGIDGDTPGNNEREQKLHLPGLQQVASKSAVVLVGGEPDAEKLDRVQNRTGIELEWVAGNDAPGIARRVREGHVGAVVILNGLVGHGSLGPLMDATRFSGVPVAYGWKAGFSSIHAALFELEGRLAGAARVA